MPSGGRLVSRHDFPFRHIIVIVTGDQVTQDVALRTEAVIVGSGAGGATTARLLSEAGLDVVVLEEGGHHGTDSFGGSISELMGRLYRNAGLSPIIGRTNIAFAEGRCLGGSTVINGAVFSRPPEEILERWGRELGLPTMEAPALNQHLARLDGDLNISPQPDREANKASWRLIEGARALGWQAEETLRAQVNCRNSNRCPTGCPNAAKQSMLVSYIPAAVNDGAIIHCDSRVDRLVMDGARVRGVEGWVDSPTGRHRIEVSADHVFICGGPMHTPFLLLKNGLTRNVGRNLRIHMNLKAVAVFPEDINPGQGTIMTVRIKEFEDRGIYFGSSNFDPVYLALTLSSHGRETVERLLPQWRCCGNYVAQIKATGRGRVKRSPFVDGPLPSYDLTPEDMDNIRFAIPRLTEVLLSSGAREVYLSIRGTPPLRSRADAERLADGLDYPKRLDLLSVHAMASCPMGTSADKTPLDPFGRVWETENLYINDASMLPEATGVNPQMTIMAVAMRNVAAFLETRSSR